MEDSRSNQAQGCLLVGELFISLALKIFRDRLDFYSIDFAGAKGIFSQMGSENI